MKGRGNVYWFFGIVLILINILADIISFFEYNSKDVGFSIGYFIGSNFLLIFGIILCRIGYKVNKKLRNNDSNNLEDEINKIGTNKF